MTETESNSRQAEISEALKLAYAKAGLLKTTKAEAKKLTKPFPDGEIEIRPDGFIYIPHIFLSDRLNRVFGPGACAIIPRYHKLDDETQIVTGEFVLLIRGCYVGESIGEKKFDLLKDKYRDAVETARAEALRSICGKMISCGNQVWQPAFVARWKKKNAETYRGVDNELYWRRKGSAGVEKEFSAPPERGGARREKESRVDSLPKDEADNLRHIMLQWVCSESSKSDVLRYAVSNSIIPAGGELENWPSDKLAVSEFEVKKLSDEIVKFTKASAPSKGWQECVVPFGANKGTKLGEHSKREIRGYWEAMKDASVVKAHPEFSEALQAAAKALKFKRK